MPLLGGAVVPHPPLLLPELGGERPDQALNELRAACRQAVEAVTADAELLVVVGDGPVWGAVVPGADGSFTPWGARVRVELPATAAPELPGLPEPASVTHLPLSLTVAAWLLAGLPEVPRVAAYSVPGVMPPGAAAGVGHALADVVDSPGERPAALLVLADGSARRGQRSPGTFHPAAEEADAGVARALATADLDVLLKLDPATCAELWLGGRVPLQVLAGAMTGTGTDVPTPLTGRVLYEAAPFGVGYVVATCLAQAGP